MVLVILLWSKQVFRKIDIWVQVVSVQIERFIDLLCYNDSKTVIFCFTKEGSQRLLYKE